MTKSDTQLLFGYFSEDEITKLYKMDPSHRFNDQLFKLKDYLITLQIHKDERSRVSGYAETMAYDDVYSTFAIHYNEILDYLSHYDYKAGTADDLSRMRNQINAELGVLREMLTKLHELDTMYEHVDDTAGGRVDSLAFWDDTPLYSPHHSSLDKPIKRKVISRLGIVTGAFVLIFLATTGVRLLSGTPDYDVADDQKATSAEAIDYDSIDMTLPQIFYYNRSLVEPNERNTVYVGPDSKAVVVGRDSLQDLIDMGFTITQGEVEVQAKGYTYNINGFSYDYFEDFFYLAPELGIQDIYRDYITPEQRERIHNLSAPGMGYAVVDTIADGGSFRVSFSSYAKEAGPDLDYSHCIIDSVTLMYYGDESSCYPFKYMDINGTFTFDDVDQYLENSGTAYKSDEDYDDDGYNEYHCYDIHTSRNSMLGLAISDPVGDSNGYTKYTITYIQ